MFRFILRLVPCAPEAGVLLLAALAGATTFPGDRAGAALVINEILVDPDGSDAGREFVELLNTGSESVDLSAVEFQFANGADGPIWKTRWAGEAGQSLGAGEIFLITDRNWIGPPAGQAEVTLALQNGPDAVRLVRATETLDLVGYGALTDSAMMEGGPVPTATGKSLARRPDGRDTNRNDEDFVAATPTPGMRNFRDWSMAVVRRFLEPPSLEQPGLNLRLEIDLQNDGTNTIPLVELELRIGSQSWPARLDEIPSEDQRTLVWEVVPTQWGTLPVTLSLLPPAVPELLTLDLGRVQIGPGGLLLSEVLAAPAQGQREWIELQAGTGALALGEYSVRDEDGSYRLLPELRLAPGELVVVAEDSAALAGWLAENGAHGGGDRCDGDSPLRIRALSAGWPSLNNSSAAGRPFADRLYLADSTGTVVDHVTWGGDDSGAYPVPDDGRSLERISPKPALSGMANWTGSTAAAGSTPGCPNSVAVCGSGAATESLAVEPRVLDFAGGAGSVHILFDVPGTAAGAQVRIFDLWGGLVRDFGADRFGPGPRDLLWDGHNEGGRPVAAGAYVVLLVLRASDGAVLRRAKALVAVLPGADG